MEVEVGPTEETVEALLDYFVEPFLSLVKSKARELPSISQHQLVAKQVHAVVLLYNYYHRKCHPALEILTFESFCKLAVVLKPNLMVYMNLMHQSNYSEIDDLENQLSLTEKAIMDACDISLALDASKQVPHTEGWPISKVAILLINSRKENCLLFLGTVTAGVWSVIEKDLDVSNMTSESKMGEKRVYKRKSSTKKLSTADQNALEVRLQKLALSTTEEVAGINQADLVVLESHAVYSLSKEKAAARFYIMQCAQPSNEDFQVPIKEVVGSLQCPLVKKRSYGWVVTPAVEYFHMLPYLEIIQDWLSREMLPNSLQDLKVESENVHQKKPPLTEKSYKIEVFAEKNVSRESLITANLLSGKTSTQIDESSEKKETTECQVTCLSNKVDEPSGMDVEDLPVLRSQNEDNGQSFHSVVKVHDQQQNMSIPEAHKHASVNDMMAEAEMVDSMSRSCTTGLGDEKNDSNKQYNISLSVQGGIPSANNELVPLRSKSQHLERLEATLASKEDALSQTALRVLLRKRERLSHQLRNLTDEIALCDKTIHSIQQGGENDLDLRKGFMIQVGNYICQDREEDAQPESKRKKFSEAILSVRNPCQELDDICHMNNWKLPTYHVYPSDGGFQSSVTLKGFDFELTIKGNMHSGSREARESAATHMITKLQSLVGADRLVPYLPVER